MTAPTASTAAVSAGGDTILLVEDDANVRELTARCLRRDGYHVLTAENGVAAVRVAGEYASPIALLLSDVVMPSMGGPSLATALRELRPALRILYMSGYAGSALESYGALHAGQQFLQKPFTIEQLLNGVRLALDPAATPRPLNGPPEADSAP